MKTNKNKIWKTGVIAGMLAMLVLAFSACGSEPEDSNTAEVKTTTTITVTTEATTTTVETTTTTAKTTTETSEITTTAELQQLQRQKPRESRKRTPPQLSRWWKSQEPPPQNRHSPHRQRKPPQLPRDTTKPSTTKL